MKILVSVYDSVSNLYSDPFLEVNEEAAIRNFRLGATQNPTINACPADFELRLIGQFSEQLGSINGVEFDGLNYKTLITASDVVKSIEHY